MTSAETESRLKTADRRWLTVAVVFAIAGMLIGFWFSFWNLRNAAAHHGWHAPFLLPLMIDLGIPTYVIIDHLIVRLGWRSLLPRMAAWGFAAETIVLNGALTSSGAVIWRITAASAPAAWVLGIEVLRLIWRVLRKPPPEDADSIPLGRWIAAPVPTFLLWRRKHLLGVSSWPVMCALEDARLYLRDTVQAVQAKHSGLTVPLSVRKAMRSGRFPGSVADRIAASPEAAAEWEPVMDSWLASRLGLAETISRALSNDSQAALPSAPQVVSPAASEATSEPASQVVSASVSKPSPQSSPSRPRKPSPSAVKRMTGADLAPYVGVLLEDDPKLNPSDLMKILKIGRIKADEALRVALEQAQGAEVIAIGARS